MSKQKKKDYNLGEYLEDLIGRLNDVLGIVVTDKDGAILAKATNDELSEKKDVELSSLGSLFATISDQTSKLEIGKNNSITTFYDNYLIFQLNVLPLVVTFIGSSDCNVGVLQALVPEFEQRMEPIIEGMNNDSDPI